VWVTRRAVPSPAGRARAASAAQCRDRVCSSSGGGCWDWVAAVAMKRNSVRQSSHEYALLRGTRCIHHVLAMRVQLMPPQRGQFFAKVMLAVMDIPGQALPRLSRLPHERIEHTCRLPRLGSLADARQRSV